MFPPASVTENALPPLEARIPTIEVLPAGIVIPLGQVEFAAVVFKVVCVAVGIWTEHVERTDGVPVPTVTLEAAKLAAAIEVKQVE